MDFTLGHTFDRGYVLKEHALEALETQKIDFYKDEYNSFRLGLGTARRELVWKAGSRTCALSGGHCRSRCTQLCPRRCLQHGRRPRLISL